MTSHEDTPQPASTEMATLGALGEVVRQCEQLQTSLDEGTTQRCEDLDQAISWGARYINDYARRQAQVAEDMARGKQRQAHLSRELGRVAQTAIDLFSQCESLVDERGEKEKQIERDRQEIDMANDDITRLMKYVAARTAQLNSLSDQGRSNGVARPATVWSTILPEGDDGSKLPAKTDAGETEAARLQREQDVARLQVTQAHNLIRALTNRIDDYTIRIGEIDDEMSEIRLQIGNYDAQNQEIHRQIDALFDGYDKLKRNFAAVQAAFASRVGRTGAILADTPSDELPVLHPIPPLPSELDFLPRRPTPQPPPAIPRIAVPAVDVPPPDKSRRRGLFRRNK